MIPPLNEHGYLPPGVHPATLEEVIARFGVGNEERQACGQSLRWLLPMCRAAGIARVVLNGSFITDREEPGDIDCVLIPGPDFDADREAARLLRFGLPYLSLQIAETREDLQFFVDDLFASDRFGRPKGLVEVLL
jgi:hypothetical protein